MCASQNIDTIKRKIDAIQVETMTLIYNISSNMEMKHLIYYIRNN